MKKIKMGGMETRKAIKFRRNDRQDNPDTCINKELLIKCTTRREIITP